MAYAHSDGTIDQQWATAGLVDVEEDEAGEDDEERVLDTGRDQVDISGQTGHQEDVNDVLSRKNVRRRFGDEGSHWWSSLHMSSRWHQSSVATSGQ